MSLLTTRFILLSVVLTIVGSTDPCPVCLDDLLPSSDGSASQSTPSPTTRTPCSHTFHLHCIRQWIEEYARNTCPSCRATIAPRAAPPSLDHSLGIVLTIGGTFGSIGSYFLFVLIGLLRESESPGPAGMFQRVILGLLVVGFLMSAISSFKFGLSLRQEALSDLDDGGDDNDIGWIMGPADIMGVNFQH